MSDPPSSKPTKDEREKEKQEGGGKKKDPFVEKDQTAEDAQLRVNKQCFLVRNIEALIGAQAAARAEGYKHFSCVTGPPMEITNELVSVKGLDKMFGLTTAQHAVLQPRIRLYLIKNGTIIELPFDASLSPGVHTQRAISDMVKSSNFRGYGAGIKSFSYELAGIDPDTADRLINAKLTLYFKTIADLFHPRNSGGMSKSRPFQYADLINMNKASLAPKRGRKGEKTIADDEDRYELKAVVGWGDPPVGHPLFPKAIRKSIQGAKATFSLQLIDHTIKYNQDGTLELDIDYMASIDYILSTSDLDIFWLPETNKATDLQTKIQTKRDELLQSDQELERLMNVKRDGAIPAGASTPTAAGNQPDTQQDVIARHEDRKKQLIEEAEGLVEQLDQLVRLRKTIAYSRITDGLLETEGILKCIEVFPSQLGVVGGRVLRTESIVKGNKKKPIAQQDKEEKANAKKIQETAQPASEEERKEMKERMDGVNKDAADDGKLTASKLKGNQKKHVQSSKKPSKKPNGKIKIFYFFLGDLIDIVLRILKSEVDGQKNKAAIETLERVIVMMGPAVLKDSRRSSGLLKVGNLADIPISYDLFENWFIYNVIRPQKETYYFKKFVIDIMDNLISPVLGSGCYSGERQKGRVASIPLTVPKLSGGGPRVPVRSRCSIAGLKNKKMSKTGLGSEIGTSSIRESNDYLYFYMRDNNVKRRQADYKKDIKKGIYHLRIGQENGLVKSVEFEKTDIPFLKEHRVTADGEHPNGFLREKYDAKIKMVGNSFFIPGQYVYIAPTVPGYDVNKKIGKIKQPTKQLLQNLGFGGYYLVTKVFHNISPESYVTELVCRWESFGESTAKDIQSYYERIEDINNCKAGAAEAASSFDYSEVLDEQLQNLNDAAGRTIYQNVGEAVKDAAGVVTQGAASVVAGYIPPGAARTIVLGILGAGQSVVNQGVDDAVDAAPGVMDAVSELGDDITGAAVEAGREFFNQFFDPEGDDQ